MGILPVQMKGGRRDAKILKIYFSDRNGSLFLLRTLTSDTKNKFFSILSTGYLWQILPNRKHHFQPKLLRADVYAAYFEVASSHHVLQAC